MRVLRTYVRTYSKYVLDAIAPHFLYFLLVEGLSGSGGGNLTTIATSL